MNKIKYLFLIIPLIVLLFPQPASAIIGTGIFDFFETALEGVEEVTNPILSRLLQIFLVYVVGLVSLVASSRFLDTVITNQVDWLTIQDNPMVRWGFDFTSGLANMFLILILVVIAFAIILKIESFQAKKTLPRLLIVALLLNFSLLFVGMLVDISNVFYSTILEGNEGIFGLAMEKIIGGGENIIKNILIWVTALGASFLIPFVAPFAQYAIIIGLPIVYLPNLVIWIFQICIFFLLTSVFSLFIFFFAARVFIIQLLAVLSPLAFLSLILPQTQKYWKMWLQHLLEWIFLGIILLFFMVLGLNMMDFLIPVSEPIDPALPFLSWFKIDKYLIYYFFLFIYLLIVVGISKKLMPTLATGLMEGFKEIGGTIWARGLKPMGKGFGKEARRLTVAQRARDEEELKKKGRKPPLARRIATGIITTPVRWGHRITGTTPEEEEMKRIAEAGVKAEKMKDPNLLLQKYKDAMRARDYGRAAEIVSTGKKKGKGFAEIIEKNVPEEVAIKLGSEANKLGLVEQAERIGRTFINVADQMGFKSYAQLDEGEQAEWNAKGYKTIQNKLIGEAEKDEIKDFAKGFWRGPLAMEAIVKFWGGPQIGKAADEFSREFVEDYMKVINKLSLNELININPKQALYLSGNPAQDLGLRWAEGLDRGEVRGRMKERAEEIPPVRMPDESDIRNLEQKIRQVFPEPPPTPPGTTPGRAPRGSPGVQKPPKPPRGTRGV